MVEKAIRDAGIGYVRIEGKVSPSDRAHILERYRHDPNIKVMLITTSCGAVG
jgi:SWI/SNF-related matrix-associated actin-dependent regulator of chromatin subfamily A3